MEAVKIKIQNWNGYNIRFIEKNGEWWVVLKDICDVLGLKTYYVKERLANSMVSTEVLKDKNSRPHKTLIVNEFGIYDTVFQSRKSEAKEFRYWVYSILKELRIESGIEGFEIFRMLDKEHQKEMMKRLKDGLKAPIKIDYIKANTISNKATSTKYGYSKMIKKAHMTPGMLRDRERILEDTVELMRVKEKYNIKDLSVSEKIYQIYN